ncbi:PTS transporter subunit EIIC [Serratia marcescens]|uniref:PTS transporter subunit EIIC n=1 Tax=Serratia marcescens TaxID=615 RepID=UPI0023612682|nr:PTS transporter subunit EIIC [Serratia marcescens]
MNNEMLVNKILTLIGGRENIHDLSHCITRLRLRLHDNIKADIDELRKTNGILGVVMANNQLQIVIGPGVDKVHSLMQGKTETDTRSESESNKTAFSWREIINTIASIFTPIIPALAGAGILKGCLILFLNLGLLTKTNGTFIILSAAADGVFYFIPILLAWSCSARFGCSAIVSISLAASLLFPALSTYLSSGGVTSFMGIPVIPTVYSSSVVPIILAVYFYSKLEKILNRIIPKALALVITPAISFCIMLPATLLVFGPFGNYTSELVGKGFALLSGYSPIVTGLVLATAYPVIVMFGMHRALVPIGINEVALQGSTSLFALYGPSNFAEAGASLGVALRLKDKKMRSVAYSAALSSLCGVTEPSLYGINMKYKTPLIPVMVAGGVGGALVGYGGSAAYGVVIPSLITLPAFYGAGFWFYLAAIILSFVIAMVTMLVIGIKETDFPPEGEISKAAEDVKEANNKHGGNDSGLEVIRAPAKGSLLNENDILNSAVNIPGRGCILLTEDTTLTSPVNGKVSNIIPESRLIKVMSNNGVETLISIENVTTEIVFKVNKGESVRVGDVLCEWDACKYPEGAGTHIRVHILNVEDFRDIIPSSRSLALTGEKILTVI